jgi:branched-chain amino acid transport system permease protein
VDILLQQLINGLVLGSIYALVALGYTMVYGILELINFAHGEILMIGGMVALTMMQMLAGSGMPGPLIVVAGLAAAIPVCVAIAFVMERIAYRHAWRRSSRRSAYRCCCRTLPPSSGASSTSRCRAC